MTLLAKQNLLERDLLASWLGLLKLESLLSTCTTPVTLGRQTTKH